MSNETSKVAIVTGASRGIGAAVAERLAADGFTVVINYSGDAKSAEALARKIEGNGGRALTAKADVSDASAVRGMFDATEAAFGGVDVLVNNAGIMKLVKIADSDDALFDQQIAVNLKGTFNALREAAKRLRDGGRIVNFSTSVVGTKLETYCAYAATKAAILSKELRGRSISVNAVAPGPTATDLFLVGKSPELIDRFGRIVPGAFTGGTNHFAHSGSPLDVARVAEYESGPYKGFGAQIRDAFAAIVPPEADASSVADAIVRVVDAPFGKRPFRVHIDPTEDGADVAFAVIDRVRNEMLHRVGFSDLLRPRSNG